jgi:hypothetical protein
MMRFKIDENLHDDVAEALRTHGHDVQTVFEEGLRGHADAEVAEAARREGRVVVTLDLDFGKHPRISPRALPRVDRVARGGSESPPRTARDGSHHLAVLGCAPLEGHLWVVSEGGIRIRPGASAEEPS